MSVTPRKPTGKNPDLEATDELPILPLEAAFDSDTATFAAIPAPADMPDLAESLRDVESHLKRKTERLRELEGQLAAAEAERRQLRAELDEERRTAAEQLQGERRSSSELLQRERASAAEQLDHERRAATAQLEAERRSATELLDRTRQEAAAKLEEQRTAAARTAEDLSGRVGSAERTLADVRSTLEARETDLSSTRARLADHERQVAELHAAAARQGSQMRHHARDLADLRARSERQHEALRHTQGFRGVLEGLLADREEELAAIEARHAAELSARDSRGAGQLQEAAGREEQLRVESASSLAALKQAHEQRERQLLADHGAREAVLGAELQQLRTDGDALRVRLEADLRQRGSELATATAQLQAAQSLLSTQAQQIEAQLAQIGQQQEELSALRANDEAARAGIELFEQQKQRIAELEGELAGMQELAQTLEQRLQALEDQNQRLETEARASVSLLGNLQQDIVRLGREDTGVRPALKLVSSSQVPDRFLVSEQDGKEIERALGRRTSIGRTPDNDIQIDAGYVSRHHAVILASTQHCIIEDLNSMNGVLVNGRRITRHALRDGDVVTIGKSVFRLRQPA
jgi:chromosome segregation ATPase